MKKIMFLTTVVLSLLTLSLSAQKGKKLKENEARVLYSVTLDCASCVTKINDNVPFMDGIKDVKVSLEKQTIVLVYRTDKTNVDKIAKELEKLGFPAKEVKKTEKKKDKKSNAKESKVLYSVTLDCEKCVKKLNDKVPFIEGIKDVEVSLEKQTILLTYRSDKTDVETIAKELKKIGFPATEIKKKK